MGMCISAAMRWQALTCRTCTLEAFAVPDCLLVQNLLQKGEGLSKSPSLLRAATALQREFAGRFE